MNIHTLSFLLFGYHGTTIQQIAIKAGVNKSAVHYYFRSKERLYTKVVKKVLDLYFDTNVEINTTRIGIEKPTWFLVSELYNNKNLFEETHSRTRSALCECQCESVKTERVCSLSLSHSL